MHLWLNNPMQKSDFHYDLPEELIAFRPLDKRSESRLMHLNKQDGAIRHKHFYDLPDLLNPGDLLVFNTTKVMPARLYGKKPTGGKVEILIERVLDDHTALAHIRGGKALKADRPIQFENGEEASLVGREGELFKLVLESGDWTSLMNAVGHMPLPPYIEREDSDFDKERYQTVYANQTGSVAAPTAGLHFDQDILQKLADKGVGRADVMLHVGAGTFQPVRTDDIKDHVMHSEYLEVTEAACAAVNETKARGGRVIAVGTTSVRCLETAWQVGELRPYQGETNIFITPGYDFKAIDGLVTNFHLPESTLLMLVSTLAGMEEIRAAYVAAIQEKYRFFSYGDAMLIL